MQQSTEIKQETRQSTSTVTVMLHGNKRELVGLEALFGGGNGQAAPLCGVSLAADAFCFQPSLSRKLAASEFFRRRDCSVARMRSASLSYLDKFNVEALRAGSTVLVTEGSPNAICSKAIATVSSKMTEQHRCKAA